MRASGRRLSASAASAETTARAAAPSLIPLELPAVTVPPSMNAGGSLASPSAVTPLRGGSSRSTTLDLAVTPGLHRHDLIGKDLRGQGLLGPTLTLGGELVLLAAG
jgi:hypothetical protein